jgi:hypothetical protein
VPVLARVIYLPGVCVHWGLAGRRRSHSTHSSLSGCPAGLGGPDTEQSSSNSEPPQRLSGGQMVSCHAGAPAREVFAEIWEGMVTSTECLLCAGTVLGTGTHSVR